jgi:hypothetical protein
MKGSNEKGLSSKNKKKEIDIVGEGGRKTVHVRDTVED